QRVPRGVLVLRGRRRAQPAKLRRRRSSARPRPSGPFPSRPVLQRRAGLMGSLSSSFSSVGVDIMPVIQFLGTIHPRVFNVSISGVPEVRWKAEELDLEMVFRIQIENSDVRVECEVNHCETPDVVAIWMRAFDLARAAVDLVCFATGIGATVTLDTLVGADGVRTTLLSRDEGLARLCTAFALGGPPGGDFSSVLNFVLAEPPLFMALNDLVTAITLPHQSLVTCARAIERLRNLVAPGLPTRDGWESLRHNLRISE